MKQGCRQIVGLLLVSCAMALAGCKDPHSDGDGHGHGKTSIEKDTTPASGESGAEEDGHGVEAAGAAYRDGKGIELPEETRKSIGLELVEVGEREMWPRQTLTAQVYRSAAEASRTYGREREGNAYATALISKEQADLFRPGQKFTFRCREGEDSTHDGVIWKIDTVQLSSLGKAEALLELPDGDRSLAVGAFIEAKVSIGSAPQKGISVPHSAILETSTGKYAYVQNGGHLLRTEIKTGAGNEEYVEVTEGLYEGDTIVVKPVETLYLIELRATKGGGHSH